MAITKCIIARVLYENSPTRRGDPFRFRRLNGLRLDPCTLGSRFCCRCVAVASFGCQITSHCTSFDDSLVGATVSEIRNQHIEHWAVACIEHQWDVRFSLRHRLRLNQRIHNLFFFGFAFETMPNTSGIMNAGPALCRCVYVCVSGGYVCLLAMLF